MLNILKVWFIIDVKYILSIIIISRKLTQYPKIVLNREVMDIPVWKWRRESRVVDDWEHLSPYFVHISVIFGRIW